jgi:nucleotidyltransferase/DNA polymerase involved in DNA repair
MRFACLLVEHLPTRVETLPDPALAGRPFVVLRDWDSRVLDASPEALAAGVAPGDARQRVEQLCPQAVIRPVNEALVQMHHANLRLALAQFASAVESGDWGELYIELGALARAFPSEEALAIQLIQQLDQATPLQPLLGLASNKFTAYQAARQAAQQAGAQSGRILIVPAGGERRFLEPLPLKVLPDPPAELLRRLHLFGLSTLGGFAQLPHAAVVLQFGSDLAFYHDLARGIDPRPLIPQSPPPALSRTLNLPEPLADRAMLLAAVERLASRAAGRLQEAGYHALALSLTVETAERREHCAGSSLKPPSSEAELLRRMSGRLLGKLSFEAAVTSLTLTAYPLREWHHGAQQLSLLDADVGVPPRLAQLRSAIRLLQQRFGEAIIRLASLIGPPLPLPIRIGARPDGAPLSLGWGGWSSRVTSVYEYWREQRGWWEQPVTRDYYEVEAENGAVFTLFRDEQGQWFLDRRRR